MIIDAHTHVFPENISEKSISFLENIGKQKAIIGGTADNLIASMKKSGVDMSVVLPVVTKPKQFNSINRFAIELNKLPGIISLAGIHPACEDIDGCLDFIKSSGFKGVKLHPDYQETDITDEGYIKILEGCRQRNLIAVIHAGIDPAYPKHIHCPPNLSGEVVRALTKDKPFIVLAHLGGTDQIDLVEEHLAGLPVYLDTSFVLDSIDRDRFVEIIKSHGYKKILFATDSPWRDAKQYIDIIKALPVGNTVISAILGSNCAEMLCI